jgi:hypothetical protein
MLTAVIKGRAEQWVQQWALPDAQEGPERMLVRYDDI